MTALIAVRSDDRVTMFSDAACYDNRGVVTMIRQKTDILFHLPAIVATRGSGFSGQFFKIAALHNNSFDELIDQFAEKLRWACDEGSRQGDAINLAAFVGGFSKREEAWRFHHMFYAVRDGEEVPGSLELHDVEQCVFDPMPSEEAITRRLGKNPQIKDDVGFIAMMQANRETSHSYGPICPGEGCIVGGFVQKTVLSADIAYTEVIHRWKDQIGSSMIPDLDEPLPEQAKGEER